MNNQEKEFTKDVFEAIQHLLQDIQFNICSTALISYFSVRLAEAGISREKIEDLVRNWVEDLNTLTKEVLNESK